LAAENTAKTYRAYTGKIFALEQRNKELEERNTSLEEI